MCVVVYYTITNVVWVIHYGVLNSQLQLLWHKMIAASKSDDASDHLWNFDSAS